MYDKIESDKIIKSFLNDLKEKGISIKSISNYKSDLNSFGEWLSRKLKLLGIFTETLSESVAFINPDIGMDYKKYLVSSNTLTSSLNRRLSTLRRLSKFLLDKGYLEFDFMGEIKNIASPTQTPQIDLESLTAEFKEFLEGEKVTKNTVKNYISDLKHFITWFNTNNSGGFK